MFIDFRERGRERDNNIDVRQYLMWKRNISQLPPIYKLGMGLARNQTHNLLMCWMTLQQISHPTSALCHSYYMPTLLSKQWRLRMRKEFVHGDSCSWSCCP